MNNLSLTSVMTYPNGNFGVVFNDYASLRDVDLVLRQRFEPLATGRGFSIVGDEIVTLEGFNPTIDEITEVFKLMCKSWNDVINMISFNFSRIRNNPNVLESDLINLSERLRDEFNAEIRTFDHGVRMAVFSGNRHLHLGTGDVAIRSEWEPKDLGALKNMCFNLSHRIKEVPLSLTWQLNQTTVLCFINGAKHLGTKKDLKKILLAKFKIGTNMMGHESGERHFYILHNEITNKGMIVVRNLIEGSYSVYYDDVRFDLDEMPECYYKLNLKKDG